MRYINDFGLTALLILAAQSAFGVEERIRVSTNAIVLKGDLPVFERKICVKQEVQTPVVLPAVFKTDENGKKVCVVPERNSFDIIPAVFETREYRLRLEDTLSEEDLVQKFKDLSAKRASVEIVGEQTERGFRVISLTEIKITERRSAIDFTIGTPF